MNKLTSLGLCALLTPAITLGVGAALAQDAETRPQGAQTQQRGSPAAPGNERAQQRGAAESAQQRAGSQSAQGQRTAHNTPILSKPAGAISAKDLTGSALLSRQDENFGPINDFILDRDGQVLAVIVGVGGFLGIGERDVAIGWDSLEHSVDEDGDVVFRVNMTDAELRAAPAYRTD